MNMIYMNSPRRVRLPRCGRFFRVEFAPLTVLGFALLFGIAVGSLFGLFTAHVTELPFLRITEPDPSALLPTLWRCSRFLLAALLISTSFLGVVLLPSLCVLRGFLFGCSVAALYSANALRGLLYAAVALGIPALFELPALLLACGACVRFSGQLLSRRSASPRLSVSLRSACQPLLWCAGLIGADTAYSAVLLPLLLARFS